MAHGDNRGLKLPPKVAPIQVVVVPIAQHKEGVEQKATELYNELNKKYRAHIDLRDNCSPGYKFNDWEMRGIPVRIEIGPRDIENGVAMVVRRDTLEKQEVKLENLEETVGKLLEEIQANMFNMCKERLVKRTSIATNLDEFVKIINENQGYIKTMWCGDVECEDKIKELTGAHSRCMPFNQEHLGDKCVCCGKPANIMVVWGRQY